MSSSDSLPKGTFSPGIFEHLQARLDEDSQVREELQNIVKSMERQGSRRSIAYDLYAH